MGSRSGIRNQDWVGEETHLPRDWRAEATCAAVDPEMWHPAKGDSATGRKAQGICRTVCPVRQECLTHALAVHEDDGIYGGFTGRSRRPFLIMVKRGVPAEDVAIIAIHGEEVLRKCAG